jgi:hypothetical protein
MPTRRKMSAPIWRLGNPPLLDKGFRAVSPAAVSVIQTKSFAIVGLFICTGILPYGDVASNPGIGRKATREITGNRA